MKRITHAVVLLPQSCTASNFVAQHQCRHWESLTSVAVQYNVDVTAIRVLNNLITDHSLRSRQAVYVPGAAARCACMQCWATHPLVCHAACRRRIMRSRACSADTD